jgi:hypothetical protein
VAPDWQVVTLVRQQVWHPTGMWLPSCGSRWQQTGKWADWLVVTIVLQHSLIHSLITSVSLKVLGSPDSRKQASAGQCSGGSQHLPAWMLRKRTVCASHSDCASCSAVGKHKTIGKGG